MPRTSPLPAVTDIAIDPRRTTIAVNGITKCFKGARVLDGIDLEIRAGELLALLGPSGSGKTTLLRIIAGLEVPDAGRIVFSGADTTRVPVQKREVGFVFQHYALFKHMTVAENIAYGLNVRPRRNRPPRREIDNRIAALLDLIKLSNFADRYPSQLSGGQRQRVALARALATEPRVLLLDEPFGALDAQVRKDLRRWLREIHEHTGQTTIFVTHDQEEALELSDRVAILDAGRLEQVGTPNEIQDRPASVAVLKFLGNALDLPVDLRSGRMFADEREIPVPNPGREGPGHLYVRPWQFEIVEPCQAHVKAKVKASFRSQGLLHLTAQNERGEIFVASVRSSADFSPDEDIGLNICGGHLF